MSQRVTYSALFLKKRLDFPYYLYYVIESFVVKQGALFMRKLEAFPSRVLAILIG